MYLQFEHEEPNNEPNEKQDEQCTPQGNPITDFGMIQTPDKQKPSNPRGNISYLPIIGHIEGHVAMPASNKTTKYEHVIPLLISAAENPEIEGLLIILNTVGGDVEAGLALSELIANIAKPTVSLVLGGGHSIGVPLAVSAKYSIIAPSAAMTIHPVRLSGTLIGAQQTYDYFNKTQDRILEFIVKNSEITKERLTKIMTDPAQLALDMGTILVGEEAVREKLIDQTGGLNDAMEKLYEMIDVERKKVRVELQDN